MGVTCFRHLELMKVACADSDAEWRSSLNGSRRAGSSLPPVSELNTSSGDRAQRQRANSVPRDDTSHHRRRDPQGH